MLVEKIVNKKLQKTFKFQTTRLNGNCISQIFLIFIILYFLPCSFFSNFHNLIQVSRIPQIGLRRTSNKLVPIGKSNFEEKYKLLV